jgi:hypothetical protein
MAKIVLRVRLVGGDHLDVSVEDTEAQDDSELIGYVTTVLAQDSGVIRSQHGDRLMILFGRGVAGFEVSPRGAVL